MVASSHVNADEGSAGCVRGSAPPQSTNEGDGLRSMLLREPQPRPQARFQAAEVPPRLEVPHSAHVAVRQTFELDVIRRELLRVHDVERVATVDRTEAGLRKGVEQVPVAGGDAGATVVAGGETDEGSETEKLVAEAARPQ